MPPSTTAELIQYTGQENLPVTLIVSHPHTLRVSTKVKVISSNTLTVLFILFFE